MAHELEMRVVQQVDDVVLGAGEEVVHADHVVTVAEQPLAEVGAEKTGAAGDQDAFAQGVLGAHEKLSLPGMLLSILRVICMP